MSTWIWFAIALIVLGIMLYRRAGLLATTAAVGAVLVVATIADSTPWALWVIFAIIALPLNITAFRRDFLAKPILDIYCKIMPSMSRTEQEAIDAGTTWWEGDLFRGNPDWKKLHRIDEPTLTAEEQAFIDGPVEEVCKMTSDWEVTHDLADLPPQVWQYLKDNGFFALIIPKQFGGKGFSAYAHSCVLQKLNSVSATLGSTVSVPNSLGPAELLLHYGTDEQKNHYLPRLAKGQDIPCFALTSPEAGSDAGAIPDKGVICKGQWNGEEVLGMRLTWDKRYITLAPVATLLGLAFKLYDPEGLLGDEEDLGITCALIPTDTDGVEIGRRHFPLNIPFQNGPTKGNDVFVPLDWIIGGPKMAGQGWRMLVECLSAGRSISLPAGAAGGSKMAALTTGAYAHLRKQFKISIGQMEGVQEALARIAGYTYTINSAAKFTAGAVDLGEKPSVPSAIIKYHATDLGRKVAIDAMDVHGGKGIMMGPKNYLARQYQGLPIGITVEGANILTRSMIIYGQGAMRCHPYILPELQAAANDDRKAGLAQFDKAIFGHVGFVMSNKVRSIWMGLTGAKLVSAPYKDFTKGYYQQMTRFSSNLAFLSDMTMFLLGGELKRRESISARLGDILSQLYLSSAVLKNFNDKGRPAHDKPFVDWAVQHSLYEAQTAIRELLDNYPNRILGKVLKGMLFPFGVSVAKPSDKLGRKVARLLQTPGAARDELTAGMFKSLSENGEIGRVEQAFMDAVAAEPVIKRAAKGLNRKPAVGQTIELAQAALAAGIINQEEHDLVVRAEEGRRRIISVDDFDPKDLVRQQNAEVVQLAKAANG